MHAHVESESALAQVTLGCSFASFCYARLISSRNIHNSQTKYSVWSQRGGSRRGVTAWGHGVGSQRGVTAWGHSVGSQRGVTAWGHSVGSQRGVTAWGHRVREPFSSTNCDPVKAT